MGACSAAWLTVTACLQVRVVCNPLLAALEQRGIHRVESDDGGQQAQVGLCEAVAAHEALAAGEARVGGGQGQHVRWHPGAIQQSMPIRAAAQPQRLCVSSHLSSASSSSRLENSSASARLKPACVVEKPHR